MKYSVLLLLLIYLLGCESIDSQNADRKATNPIIYADVPDPSMLRVGDTYYMSSTTMHMNPGQPIMKSKDLVSWEMLDYTYDIIADTDALALRNDEVAYGGGSWASSLRYHNGVYYLTTFANTTGETYVYKTTDIESGDWDTYTIDGLYHDMSLHFEDDGRVFMIYGVHDIRIVELTEDATAIKESGVHEILIPSASDIAGTEFFVRSEGAQMHKVNGKYYVFLIVWPRDSMRTQLVYRADELFGDYEGRIILEDSGIAQGGMIDTPDGDWYAMLFQDNGAVGRTPFLIPMTWEDDWPVLGEDLKAPRELDLPAPDSNIPGIVTSDNFERSEIWEELLAYEDNRGENDYYRDAFPLQWQWNHNPDNRFWSLTDRPGYLRLTNDRIDTSFVTTRNTITQRTFGPQSSAVIALETANMNNGDIAGLGALQRNYGFVGVHKEDENISVIMRNGSEDYNEVIESISVDVDRIYLRIDMDFTDRTDEAMFYYSLSGNDWQRIGNTLQMSYTLPHFMGYRFALFNYATETTGGYVDFDFFKNSDSIIQL